MKYFSIVQNCTILGNGLEVINMAKIGMSEASVIREMFISGATCRKELSQLLGLSKATICQVVNRLLAVNWIEEGGCFNNLPVGRKTATIKVRSNLVYFLGTDITGLTLRACIIDSQKNVIARGKRAVGLVGSPEKITDRWLDFIKDIISSAQIKKDDIAGIGFGFPGMLSENTHRVSAYLPPGLKMDLDFSEIVESIGLPATIANNTICVSEYESKLGVATSVSSFVSVLIRYGIGTALYANGSCCVGKAFIGEFGHMRIDRNGPVCICGRKGCLDVFVSGRTWPAEGLTTDRQLQRELKRRSQYLGLGIANLLKLFYPQVIIMNGIYNKYEDIIKPELEKVFEKELDLIRLKTPRIVFGEPSEMKASIGAAIKAADLFLEEYLVKKFSAM